MRPDGTLAYLERMDRQVKVRGVRIELGEVEAALRAHPAVADTAVVARKAAGGDLRLAAYVVFGDAPVTVRELREDLLARLPGYAVPSSVTVLPALPRSASGKLSPAALPEPDPADVDDTGHVAPRDETEEVIAGIWPEALGVPRIGDLDDFFALGGHSLLATRAVNRMRRAFGAHLPLSVVFECPTVAATAERVHELLLAEIEAMPEEEALRLLAQTAPTPHHADTERGTTR
jgi:hypothetical protein